MMQLPTHQLNIVANDAVAANDAIFEFRAGADFRAAAEHRAAANDCCAMQHNVAIAIDWAAQQPILAVGATLPPIDVWSHGKHPPMNNVSRDGRVRAEILHARGVLVLNDVSVNDVAENLRRHNAAKKIVAKVLVVKVVCEQVKNTWRTLKKNLFFFCWEIKIEKQRYTFEKKKESNQN